MSRTIGILLLVTFLTGLFAGQALTAPQDDPETDGLSATSAPLPDGLTAGERRDIEIFRRASASTVYISRVVTA